MLVATVLKFTLTELLNFEDELYWSDVTEIETLQCNVST